jgi:long-chain acyl-CoA synthetase
MFHAADLIGTAFTMVGAAHSYVKRFRGEEAIDLVDRYGVSVTMMTPTMMADFLVAHKKRDRQPRRLRHLVYGSSPVVAERIREFAEAFPAVGLQQGYGLTETSPILTMLNPADHEVGFADANSKVLRSAGAPLIGVDIRIADADDCPLGVDQVGEILVRGPNVMNGYYRRPNETEHALRGGWFHTGDLGMLDQNGYLHIVDRLKDMIVTGGENVYSGEVEAVLFRHPDVQEAAVIGIADARYGEALLAAIVPVDGQSITAEEIQLHCRRHIGGYKVPRHVVFLDALPRSALGKVLKHELKQRLQTAAANPASGIQ